MSLERAISERIRKTHQELQASGKTLAVEDEQQQVRAFRARFGPDELARLDGESLLETMHLHANHDSLVYWLEFKDDQEFASPWFGGIGGGTALKFGVYRSSVTQQWTTGHPRSMQTISVDQAIDIARRHRDQLVAGARAIEELDRAADQDAYRQLQDRMLAVAPDVADMAWGHKYFSVLFPEKLDDYHNAWFQRFNLVKILRTPPLAPGRYLPAGEYVALCQELDLSMHVLTRTLGQVNGRPRRYWRIQGNLSDGMLDGGYLAIGWEKVGDLSGIRYDEAGKKTVQAQVQAAYGSAADWKSSAQQLFYFATFVAVGDIVVVTNDRSAICGIGRVTGAYEYASGSDLPHHRPVTWTDNETWELPLLESTTSVVADVRDARVQIAIERKLLTPELRRAPRRTPETDREDDRPDDDPPLSPLAGIPARVADVLARKKQVILYGPPGTGKTYWAQVTARELASRKRFGRACGQLTPDQQSEIVGRDGDKSGLVRLCSFHPAYGYEDFLEGYRPAVSGDQMQFVPRDGIFKQLCADATRQPDRDYYLIVDEINRGDIPRIFGELITLIERDKRGVVALLPLSGDLFAVPENVYLIGTMNTADRSVALLDAALRRRFGFVELMPDGSVLGNATVNGIPLGPWLDALNRRICEHVGRDARNLQIGHSYLLANGQPIGDFPTLARVVREDLIPLLEEYCYEDYAALERILGKGLVDAQRQLIKHELFGEGMEDDLRTALLAPCPEVATAAMPTDSPSDDTTSDALDDTADPVGTSDAGDPA